MNLRLSRPRAVGFMSSYLGQGNVAVVPSNTAAITTSARQTRANRFISPPPEVSADGTGDLNC
jgi:hypothetical protein